jgi:hypothetical protein
VLAKHGSQIELSQPLYDAFEGKNREGINKTETADELSKRLDFVNDLPAVLRKSLRRTISARAKVLGLVANEVTKRFEKAGEPATESNTPQTPAPSAEAPAPEQPSTPPSDQEEKLLEIINGATSSDHLASIATTSNKLIEASPELKDAFQKKLEQVKSSEQQPDAHTSFEPMAKAQTTEWFTERIGTKIWMQGTNEEQWTGAYDVENDGFPAYLVGLQMTEGYTFRDLSPDEVEEPAAVAEETAAV